MDYNTTLKGVAGDDEDMRTRRVFLSRLGALEESFFPRLRYQDNPTPQTIYLK
jgi:hypothetical protein